MEKVLQRRITKCESVLLENLVWCECKVRLFQEMMFRLSWPRDTVGKKGICNWKNVRCFSKQHMEMP